VLAFFILLIFLISTLKKTTGGKIKGLRGETIKNWGVTRPSWGETKSRLGENPLLPGERVINKRTRTVKALSPKDIGNKFSKKRCPLSKGDIFTLFFIRSAVYLLYSLLKEA
jgi:hypothetical protein